MPYEVVWSTDSSLVGRKRGVQRDFVPTVKPVYTYATRKSANERANERANEGANEVPSSRTHRVGSEIPKEIPDEIPKGKPDESHQRSTDAKITTSAGQNLKFDGSICSLKEGLKRIRTREEPQKGIFCLRRRFFNLEKINEIL